MKSGVKQAILDGSGTVIGAMIMAFGTSLFLLNFLYLGHM